MKIKLYIVYRVKGICPKGQNTINAYKTQGIVLSLKPYLNIFFRGQIKKF